MIYSVNPIYGFTWHKEAGKAGIRTKSPEFEKEKENHLNFRTKEEKGS